MPLVEDPKNYTPIGKQYLDKASKTNNEVVTIRELSNEMHKKYVDNLQEAALKGKKKFDGDFYIEVTTKPEKLIKTVLRNYYSTRKSCATPFYDQTLYKFNAKDENIEFMWVVPSKHMCKELYRDRLLIDTQDDPLLSYVLEFMSGKLLKRAMFLNNELK